MPGRRNYDREHSYYGHAQPSAAANYERNGFESEFESELVGEVQLNSAIERIAVRDAQLREKGDIIKSLQRDLAAKNERITQIECALIEIRKALWGV